MWSWMVSSKRALSRSRSAGWHYLKIAFDKLPLLIIFWGTYLFVSLYVVLEAEWRIHLIRGCSRQHDANSCGLLSCWSLSNWCQSANEFNRKASPVSENNCWQWAKGLIEPYWTHDRYLENSGCVGMCVNMCKLPTQDFFTKEFGLPLTMNPSRLPHSFVQLCCFSSPLGLVFYVSNRPSSESLLVACMLGVVPVTNKFEGYVLHNLQRKLGFQYPRSCAFCVRWECQTVIWCCWQTQNVFTDFEDMSCEMIYGQMPPPPEEDPAFQQPCFKDICEFRAMIVLTVCSQFCLWVLARAPTLCIFTTLEVILLSLLFFCNTRLKTSRYDQFHGIQGLSFSHMPTMRSRYNSKSAEPSMSKASNLSNSGLVPSTPLLENWLRAIAVVLLHFQFTYPAIIFLCAHLLSKHQAELRDCTD